MVQHEVSILCHFPHTLRFFHPNATHKLELSFLSITMPRLLLGGEAQGVTLSANDLEQMY